MIYQARLIDVLKLDSSFYQPPEDLRRFTVGEMMPMIHREIRESKTDQYQILWDSMRYYGQAVPFHVTEDKTRLRDGMHRIALATLLNWHSIDLSTERITYDEWNNSEIGQRYYALWRGRFAVCK